MNLEGKVALITGGARRIGRAITLELAGYGCDVAVHYRTAKTDAEETAELVRGLGRKAVILSCDLADPAATAELPKQAAEALGGLNILVNNAATFESMNLDTFTVAKWHEALAMNLTAPMVLAHSAFSLLSADAPGHVVNLVDIAADRPWPDYLAYCAAKAGLVNLTRSLAKAMAPSVHVNAVAPGAALFPEDYDEAKIKAITRRIPTMRSGTPKDVAAAVRFLIAGGDYITGEVLGVDGGRGIAF